MPAAPVLTPDPAPELPALLRLAIPLVGANLLQMAVAAVDVVFVARLGTVDFAAATLGVFLFTWLLYALIGLTSAAAPLIAAERGARAHAVREVRLSVRMALWVGAIGCVPALAVLLNGEALFRLAGQDAAVAARAGRFLDAIAIAIVPGVAAGILRTAAAALGRPGWTFAATGLALAVGIAANWALVFGNAGFPALGLAGSALATIASLTAMMLAYLAILARDRRLRRYRLLGRWWRPDWTRARAIARLGAPIMMTWMFEGALFGGAAILMGLIGVAEVAAHAVALNIAAIAFQLPWGIAQAATIRVGLAYGAADAAWIARAGRTALMLGTGVMAGTALAIWLFPRPLIGLYLDADGAGNARVAMLAAQYLGVAAAFQLVDGAQAVAAGVLRGVQDTRVPMLIAGFGYWVAGFGASIALGFGLGLEGLGIWLGLAFGLAVVAALLLARWRARDRLGLVPGAT